MSRLRFQNLNLTAIKDDDIKFAITELSKTLNIGINESGKKVVVEQGLENSVESAGNTIKIVYASLENQKLFRYLMGIYLEHQSS